MKLSQQEIDNIRNDCNKDSSDMITYFEEKEHQNKIRNNINFVILIADFLISLIALFK